MTRSPCKELSIDKNQKTMATKKSDSRTRTAVGMDISWRIEDLTAEYPTANSKSGETLQEAFKKFRNHRQRAIRLSKETNENILKSRADPVLMERLRIKFLERCKHYFGVPYAKKYQDPDTPEFNSPIFLDCCGLIRRVLRDLKEDFGFEVGPWNQAYMFDTLPKDIEGTENVKPGDLVFVSGIYYNKKSKRQRHNMVHVEVWAGDGEKTIGARWQKGKVQYHDSYKFTAKSYHSMQYHFKSIDTWLMGICKSHCKEHAWKRSTYKPGKKSIFSVDQTDELEDQEADPREESDSQTHGNSVKKDSKNSALEATNSDSMQYLRRKDQNLTNKTDLGFVKNFMIERNQLPRATNQTVLRESNSAKLSNSGLRISNLNHQNSELATFYDLEDCVQWLVSHVTNEAENELTIMGDNLVELNRCDSRIMSTDSASMESGEGVITVDGLDKTSVSSCTELRRIQNCSCPQCFQIEMHCIHEKTSNSKNEDKSESEFETLEENRELATSLECFDFVFDCGNQYEQISSDCIIQCPNHSSTNGSRRSTRSVSPSKVTRNGKGGGSSGSSGDRGSDNEGNNKKDMPFKNTRDGAKSVNRLSTKQPSFFIGGGNGNWMIEATLVSLGWRKIEDKRDESFNLKWVECKSQINYESFREGVQIANHISNINLLTTKLGLLCSLQEYERVTEKVGRAVGSKMRIPLSEFVPETHRLMGTSEKLKFVNEVYKDGETWICKPTGMNQGKGIYLVSSREQLVEKMNLDGTDDGGVRRSRVRPPQGRIIQRYVMNPLLLNGYKFDIRAYMLIASTTPYIVLYHSGYVRLSCVPYTPYTQDDRGLHAHLTNQFVQKKHPMYSSMKEDTVWSFDRLQSYIDQKYAKDKELPENWVFTTFTKRMHQIMCTCFQSVRQKLHRRTGTFDLLGFDFLIDDDFKVWLLEVNVNPALHTNCQVLMDLLPGVVDETLKLVIEICDKTKKKRSLLPLENLEGFQVLYCEGGK